MKKNCYLECYRQVTSSEPDFFREPASIALVLCELQLLHSVLGVMISDLTVLAYQPPAPLPSPRLERLEKVARLDLEARPPPDLRKSINHILDEELSNSEVGQSPQLSPEEAPVPQGKGPQLFKLLPGQPKISLREYLQRNSLGKDSSFPMR